MSMRKRQTFKKDCNLGYPCPSNVGSGNDIEKTATHSYPRTHSEIFFATSVKPRENESEK